MQTQSDSTTVTIHPQQPETKEIPKEELLSLQDKLMPDDWDSLNKQWKEVLGLCLLAAELEIPLTSSFDLRFVTLYPNKNEFEASLDDLQIVKNCVHRLGKLIEGFNKGGAILTSIQQWQQSPGLFADKHFNEAFNRLSNELESLVGGYQKLYSQLVLKTTSYEASLYWYSSRLNDSEDRRHLKKVWLHSQVFKRANRVIQAGEAKAVVIQPTPVSSHAKREDQPAALDGLDAQQVALVQLLQTIKATYSAYEMRQVPIVKADSRHIAFRLFNEEVRISNPKLLDDFYVQTKLVNLFIKELKNSKTQVSSFFDAKSSPTEQENIARYFEIIEPLIQDCEKLAKQMEKYTTDLITWCRDHLPPGKTSERIALTHCQLVNKAQGALQHPASSVPQEKQPSPLVARSMFGEERPDSSLGSLWSCHVDITRRNERSKLKKAVDNIAAAKARGEQPSYADRLLVLQHTEAGKRYRNILSSDAGAHYDQYEDRAFKEADDILRNHQSF